jgi:hypothetical protein
MTLRLGWHETLYRFCQLLYEDYNTATGHRKGSIRAAYNHIEFILPGVHWVDHELVIHRPEEKPTDESQPGGASETP